METSGRHQRLAKYLFLVLSISLVACGEKVIDLDKKGIQTTTYQALPQEVQSFIDAHIDSITVDKDIYFSTDPAVKFTYAHSSVPSTGWMDDNRANYHHFFIDGLHCRMSGTRGQPFILHDKVIYFCDLNLLKDNYKTHPYFKVEAISQ